MTGELTEELHSWKASGRTAAVDGTHVWYRTGGRGPWLVCFHGFPTSSWDWHRLLPLLTAHFRVLVFDFPGYGLSEKSPHRNYSLVRQMDAVEAFYAIATQMCVRNPLVRLETLDDVGHYPQLEAAEMVAASLLETIASAAKQTSNRGVP